MGQITLEIDKPYPKQIEFFKATNRYIAYGGARGGGKSWSARVKVVLLALNYPRYSNIAFKKDLERFKGQSCYPFTKVA